MNPELFWKKDSPEDDPKKGEIGSKKNSNNDSQQNLPESLSNGKNNAENKNSPNKNSLENIGIKANEIDKEALKISPESKKDLDWARNEFNQRNKEIENELTNKKITPDERDNKMKKSVEKYIEKITELVGIMEWSQSIQSKKFWEENEKQQKNYLELLEDFLEKLKLEVENRNAKNRINVSEIHNKTQVVDRKNAKNNLEKGLDWLPWKIPENPKSWNESK